MFLKTRIETKLREQFSPSFLSIEDESHLHVNHGDYRPDGGSHFKVILVSSLFEGYNRIERHKKIYACLEQEIKDGVHSLCLKTLSPEEALLTALE